MDMANLPATQPRSSDAAIEALADQFADGHNIAAVAAKLAGPDPKKRRNMRRKLRRIVYTDARMREVINMNAQVEAIVGAVPAVQALSRRASRGRTDSIKLLLAMAGIYNERITHEHTGEINIKMEGMIRPPRTVDSTAAEVIDADVVE